MSDPFVFISYSRQDRHFVDRLSRELQLAGVRTWTDTQNIAPGADFRTAISQSLQDAKVLIYVSSKNSAGSEWMQHELHAFLARPGTQVLPLVLDDAGRHSMPEFLRTIHWLDFTGDFEQPFSYLLKAVHSLRGAWQVESREPRSKGYVFLSYASEDSDFVSSLKAFLAGRGYSFWDYLASKKNYQVDYTLELEERISNAEATLSVVSPDWKKSTTALQELHFSKELGKPVFILRAKALAPTLLLAGLTFIDFTVSREAGFSTLAEEMASVGL